MSNEIQGIRTVYNLEALALVNPEGYKRAFNQIADSDEAIFWEGYYYELFEEFFDNAGQPLLTAPDNQYGKYIRGQGTVLIPSQIREQWQKHFGVDIESAEVGWKEPSNITLAFERQNGVSRIPREACEYLATYVTQLVQDFMAVAAGEVEKIREPGAVRLSAEDQAPLFDFAGNFVIFKDDLHLTRVSTQLDTTISKGCAKPKS